MINLSMAHKQYREYTESPTSIVSGQAFYQDKLYQNEALSALVSTWSTPEQFTSALNELNGFYALICHQDKQVFAAVDRVRSIPLFYGQKGADFYLSDSAEWVREKLGNQKIDPLAKEEFLLTGYVTGSDTLFPDVKQLQAGEAIIVEETKQGLSVMPIRYYRFIHEYEQYQSMEELMEEHDQVLLRMFKRLIEVANGRTLVVPLSGGYDSRLIVLMLKRLGYENIITFSYGRPGNKESEVSRKVAESLGLKWEFVEYNNGLWCQWYHSDEYSKYERFAGGFVSLPHIQDWPAVWQLKKNKVIPDDSIFVPGHSADLPAGSRSKSVPVLYKNKAINIPETITEILRYHYSLFDWTKKRDQLEPLFISHIKETLGCIEDFPDGASAFESWDIGERQAKFIINSLRIYDFWGYSWWMPFWDYDYMQFWSTVPLEYRMNQAMYEPFVNSLFYTVTGCVLPRDDLNPSYKQRFINVLRPIISKTHKERIKKTVKANKIFLKREYTSHPLALWGIYSLDDYLMKAKKIGSVNSAAVEEYMLQIEPDYLCTEVELLHSKKTLYRSSAR